MTTLDAEKAAAPPKPRFTPTLDTLSPSQIEAVRKVPPYGTQPEPVMLVRHPASDFTRQERFDEEQRRVFRRLAVPLMPSAAMKEPGTALAMDAYGLPLLITRAKDGAVRVFLNACQHKGAKVLEGEGCQKTARLTCPYHAWTYALDGQLIGVARADVFENLDKADYRLAELPSREFAGAIWASLDRHAEPDFSHLTPQIEADMDGLRIPGAHVYGHRRFRVKANWKLVLEPFLESYHVPRLHKASIGGLFGEITRVIDRLGPHQRKTAGKMDYHPDMLKAEGENIHKLVTFAYQIFPNLVVITSPYYISFMLLIPDTVGETVVDYYMLTLAPPDNPKAEDVYARSFAIIQEVFGGEDFRAAEISQAGLQSGALDFVTYGGMEVTIPMFYEELDAAMARGAAA